MTLTELAQRLVELGKDATPAPWRADRHDKSCPLDLVIGGSHTVICDLHECTSNNANADYIAAARDADKLSAAYLQAVDIIRRINSLDNPPTLGECRDFLVRSAL